MYQKLISDYIVHKLHSKFRIHTICIYEKTTELKIPVSHIAAYRSTTQSNTNQSKLKWYFDQSRSESLLHIIHAAAKIVKMYKCIYVCIQHF